MEKRNQTLFVNKLTGQSPNAQDKNCPISGQVVLYLFVCQTVSQVHPSEYNCEIVKEIY